MSEDYLAISESDEYEKGQSYSKEDIKRLPDEPGVYRFFDGDENLIYVGKAKSLKKRVGSYFTGQKTDRKTLRMVSEIHRLEITVVGTELDALLLENSLIKSYQPKYNILLRDDKSYPFLCVSRERFPQIYPTRRRIAHKGEYFGPYASVKAMNNILELIRRLYTIRTCRYDLSVENVSAGKFRVCLEYHIGNCKGPCEGLQSEVDYNEDIRQAKNIIKGKLSIAKAIFKKRMEEAAAQMRFEEAQRYYDRMQLLEKYQAKSAVVNPDIKELEVYSITSDEKRAFVNHMVVQEGSISHSESLEFKKKLNESNEEIMSLVIAEIRKNRGSTISEIICNVEPDFKPEDTEISVPKIGDKKHLVNLSFKNALQARKEKKERLEQSSMHKKRVLKKLQADLGLRELPDHIECFDNSNLQGTNPVASMVCFKDGKPSKKDYRHFKIKTVVGPDDFASMTEVVGRRYSRLLKEEQPLPKLIIIDGGKGQLSSAVEALKELGLEHDIPIVGIAKRLEEIYHPGDPYPLHIDKKSEGLKLMQQLRDEAHRFAITFHRDLRSKGSIKSELEEIPGLGKAGINKLLKQFKSLKKIKEASLEEIQGVLGEKKGLQIYERLKNED
ncbi:MAG: excinuclease ABC subunit UvrC [Cyclobacteriaceae bacterium]|nr:excinuclease ABC subunit C [Cyclobacteriaceae bacterium]MCH8517180.1 excinuclease ABC subunit UvrC [Cyclobacteriaceae bacterium]